MYSGDISTGREVNEVTDAAYTSEVMSQAGMIYDRLNRMPSDKRIIAAVMADAYISGMLDHERLVDRSGERREGA
jgi:hypothetical protein